MRLLFPNGYFLFSSFGDANLMSVLLTPLPESEATDKVAQTFERIKELLGVARVPEPFLFYARVPSFLQDFFMNSKRFVFSEGKLSVKLKTLLALVVCAQRKCEPWTEFFGQRAQSLGWSQDELAEAIAIGATCAMYNTYFKFRDLASRDVFHALPIGLRAHAFGGTSLDDSTVELLNIAVSSVNGCHACVVGHVGKAIELGVSEETILEAVQCTATMMAGATFLE